MPGVSERAAFGVYGRGGEVCVAGRHALGLPGGAGGVEDLGVAERIDLDRDRSGPAAELVAAPDHRRGPAVLDQLGQLRLGQAVRQRDRDRARLQHRHPAHRVVEPVTAAEHQRDSVSWPYTLVEQAVGSGVRALVPLGECQGARSGDDEGFVVGVGGGA